MSTRAIVLAAGMGTRLRPITEQVAKPAIPVVGVPALWFNAWHMRKTLGRIPFHINHGHKSESVLQAALDPRLAEFAKIKFQPSDESAQILGSSGALRKILDEAPFDGRFAVANADSISFLDWKRMLRRHRSLGTAVTMHVREFASTGEEYTTLTIDSTGRRLQAMGPKEKAGLMFAGNYVIETSAVRGLIPDGASELRQTVLEPLLAQGGVGIYREDGPWLDLGTIAALWDSQFHLPAMFEEAKPLIHLVMNEVESGVWIPKSWDQDQMGFLARGPVVLVGSQDLWSAQIPRGAEVGPDFAGLAPPTRPLRHNELASALVFQDFVQIFQD